MSSPLFAQWCNKKEGYENATGSIVGTTLARLTKRHNGWPQYEVSTMLERERAIQEISEQIQQYALPFFARFSDLEKLAYEVEQSGFFPHRKGLDAKKRNQAVVRFFREYPPC